MRPILVGVAGPSGAGKSTVCRRLIAQHPFIGRLKFDDFFCDEADVDRHPMGFANWDHPSSIKWGWLVRALRDLKQGLPTEISHYERAVNRATGVKQVHPAPLLLVDGYQVLYDPRVRELLDTSLYFDLPEHIQLDRRMERQPDVDTGYLYHVMIPAARAYLYPTRRYADALIPAELTPDEVYAHVASRLAPMFAKISAEETAYATRILEPDNA